MALNQTTPLVGTLAPDFDLPCTRLRGSDTSRARLTDFRGRWLVLVFYPRDFSLVCPTELTGLSQYLHEFRQRGCELLGISCDPIETHERWIATPRSQGGLAGLAFPLASDEDGATARAYGVYLEYQHVALRGLFIIDPNGVLQYQVVHNLSVGRRADDVTRVLAALQTGGLCAENWNPGEPTIDPTRNLGPGSLISHYLIEERIGSGTFATVFRAVDTTLQRQVALKVLKPDSPMTPSTALAEARSAAALSHPNVCTVFGVDDTEGVPIIAMEYLEGRSLGRLLRDGPLPQPQAIAIARQVALGLASAHAQGVVHGDLKPENVIVNEEGYAKILDFGLSRRDRRSVDPAETVVLGMADSGEGLYGTPGYMAPEQTEGEPSTTQSDVFSFGVMLFEMLTGGKAFAGENVLQVLTEIRGVQPEELAAQVDERWKELLRRTLVREASARQITMAEIAGQLRDT